MDHVYAVPSDEVNFAKKILPSLDNLQRAMAVAARDSEYRLYSAMNGIDLPKHVDSLTRTIHGLRLDLQKVSGLAQSMTGFVKGKIENYQS